MPVLEINGRDVEVDDSFLSMSPEQQNAVVDEIAGSLGRQPPKAQVPKEIAELPYGQPPEGMVYNPKTGQMEDLRSAANPNIPTGRANAAMLGAGQGAGFNLLDEAAAGLNSLTGGDYGYDVARMREAERRAAKEHPGAYYGGMVGGGLTTAVGAGSLGLSPLANLPARSGLGARVVAGAKEGAAYGGLYGSGSGEGALDRVTDAVGGAVAGGAIGGAVPVIAQVVKSAAKPVVDAVKARVNPGGYASQKIVERLSDANRTVEGAASRMDDGLSLADVGGKSTRSLLRTTTNIPGKAQDFVASKLNLRQMGQGDRIKDVVRDVFADPDGFITAGEKLSKKWSAVGDEVYAPALAKKVVWTDRLKQFVNEPIFQRGLAQGVKIQRLESLAEGKPFNPVDYAITGFNEAGDPIIGGVPNMRTLNVVKKGLDVMIGDARNPLTGKLTEEGRALDMVRRSFLGEIDSWNPAYKQARGVWGGFAKVKEAMLFGQNDALGMSPEAVAKSFKGMSEAERQAARIGIADALRKKIDAVGFGHNAVLKIFGNRQSIGVLKAAMPDQETFNAFRRAMLKEARKRATYEAVSGNSTTVRQLADMAEAGGIREGVDFAKNAVTQGPVSATLQWVGSRLRMLGGLTPEVADNIARRLTATNPDVVRRMTAELARIERQQLTSAQRANEVQALISRALAAPTVSAISGN